MRRKKPKTAVPLPKNVQAVTARGRVYFYYQEGRGTKTEGERIPLPRDPQSPEFWAAVRKAQGQSAAMVEQSFDAAVDAYLTGARFNGLAPGTREMYLRELNVARAAWGSLPAHGLKPKHIQGMVDEFAAQPGKANNFLGTMRAFSQWAFKNDYLSCSITEGVEGAKAGGGHKPWSDAQIIAAHEKLTGMVKRGVMLMLYTGQRGSDVVRLGPTFVDEGGFALGQRKTGVQVWCPIVPELEAEMQTWERRPGPYLLQADGRPYTRKRMSKHFREMADEIPELKDATLHGLRATAVVRLRREGMTNPQIEDIVGMSAAMVARYSRFADLKVSGKLALHKLRTGAEARLENIGKLANKDAG